MSRARVVFMGTAEFAVPSLRALAQDYELVAVYTKADAPSRRGGAAHPTPVRIAAEELGLPVRTPLTLRGEHAAQELTALDADVFVVAAYGLILPQDVLDIPLSGCVNVHGSLLPRWRGAAPVERAILAQDGVTGVCLMQMEAGLDTGPVCACAKVPIGDRYRDELTAELAAVGAELLVHHMPSILDGSATWVAQDSSAAVYADKILKQDVVLSPTLTASEAVLRVRASSDHAPAVAHLNGVRSVVVRASASDFSVPAGDLTLVDGMLVAGFAQGALVLEELKPAGKRAMSGADWARGARIGEGAQWA